MEYLDHALEQDLHTTLHKAKVWLRKKGKHLKDDTRGIVPVKKRRVEGCKCETCKKSWSWGHKHLRAKRVYLEENEYKITTKKDLDNLDTALKVIKEMRV